MTIISVVLGRTFHYVDEILPFRYCYETSFTFRIYWLMVNDGMDVLNISAIRCSKYWNRVDTLKKQNDAWTCKNLFGFY